MTDVVNIRVLFFGAARDAVEANQLDLALEAPATVASAFQSLTTRFSTLERFGRSLLFAVNQEYATPDTELKENDELAVFPPVSGGGSHDFF
jgi:molybdopterin converting factor subunit 1